ncbi:MAG: alpha-glucuronidase, partial [Mediterranea sp.]|nr:alpha-glucuronidase [Mediterranea sp.]
VWDRHEKHVDAERFAHIQHKLKIQMRDAIWWKDACLLYFQEFSGRPVPYGIERSVHDLKTLKQFRLNINNHTNAPAQSLFMK